VRSFGSCCTAGARRYLPGKEAFRDWCHHAFSDRPSLILRCLDNVAGQIVEAAQSSEFVDQKQAPMSGVAFLPGVFKDAAAS
jgi:hypothetical protein